MLNLRLIESRVCQPTSVPLPHQGNLLRLVERPSRFLSSVPWPPFKVSALVHHRVLVGNQTPAFQLLSPERN